jgi:hypothetical protein
MGRIVSRLIFDRGNMPVLVDRWLQVALSLSFAFAIGCSSSKTESADTTAGNDSVRTTQRLAAGIEEARKELGTTSTRSAGTPDSLASVCEAYYREAAAAYSRNEVPDTPIMLGTLKCKAHQDNRAECAGVPAAQPCGTIVMLPTNQDATQPPVESSVVDVSDPKQVRDACARLAQNAAASSPRPELVLIAGPAGAYTCDAYMKAVARSDPLLIVAPMQVPIVQLAKDTKEELDRASEKLKMDPKLVAAGMATVPAAIVTIASYDLARRAVKNVLASPVVAGPVARTKKGKLGPEDVAVPTITVPIKSICRVIKC